MSTYSFDAERTMYIDWDRYYDEPDDEPGDEPEDDTESLREEVRESRELFLGYARDRY